jgi:hypothetical protein
MEWKNEKMKKWKKWKNGMKNEKMKKVKKWNEKWKRSWGKNWNAKRGSCMYVHGYVDEFGSCSICGLFTQKQWFCVVRHNLKGFNFVSYVGMYSAKFGSTYIEHKSTGFNFGSMYVQQKFGCTTQNLCFA